MENYTAVKNGWGYIKDESAPNTFRIIDPDRTDVAYLQVYTIRHHLFLIANHLRANYFANDFKPELSQDYTGNLLFVKNEIMKAIFLLKIYG